MKLIKVEAYIYDFDDLGAADYKQQLSNMKYAIVHVADMQTADIDQWSDDHILNQNGTSVEEFRKYFK